MDNNSFRIFDSSTTRTEFSVVDFFSFKTLYFLGIIGLASYLLYYRISFIENPILYLILGIFLFYLLLFSMKSFFIRKVVKLTIDNQSIIFLYQYQFKNEEIKWTLNSTDVELIELRNAKSFFDGIKIKFKNNTENFSLQLLENNWTYIDLENIYLEFKARKNETIPENEKSVFKQLQLINNTINKNNL